MSARARTIFLGSGEFAVPVVSAVARHPEVALLGVITAPERRTAAGQAIDSPLAQWAAKNGIPAYRPNRLREAKAIDTVAQGAPELLVLADYGQIVPPELLAIPRFGALNLHPSLLPRHRGASPIQAAILGGDRETGVSLIQMDAGLDSGPIVAQRKVVLAGDEMAPELELALAHLAADLTAETLGPWLAGEIAPRAQDSAEATMTRPLQREDGRLDPARGIVHADRQLRALRPWPGTFIETDSGRIIVKDARALGGGVPARVGSLVRLPADRLALAASDGLLELVEVQPAGGRQMSGAELLRGRPALAGTLVVGPPTADQSS